MDFVEVATDYCSEACVKCDVDGTEEVGIKEDITDTKDIPEAQIFPQFGTEHEVRIWWCV
jgi:wyosine [tRNA(Phe)-imidazoG37] synthetase (radical SAM superfamily)